MTVAELRDMLAKANPDATVKFEDVYGEYGRFTDPVPVTGMVYDRTEVILTNEDTS